MIWLFLLHPQIGLLGRWLNRTPWLGLRAERDAQAMLLVVLASAWKQVSYNFIFFAGRAAIASRAR